MAIGTNNEKLAVLDWTELEPGLPLSPGAFGQGDKQQLLWGYPGVVWTAASTLANEKLAHLEWCNLLEPGLPVSSDGLDQADKQQLLWGYPDVVWGGTAPVTDNTKLANLEWCNLLEPGLPPSPGAFGQDDKQQLLWGYPDVAWESISTPDSASGVRRRKDRRRYRYPRKIRIGDAWVLVRSFEEERSTLLRYRGELEEKVSESKLPSQRAAAKQRIVYTTKRLAEVSAERKRMIRRTDKELVILAALSWL